MFSFSPTTQQHSRFYSSVIYNNQLLLMFPTTPKTHLSHTATSEYYRSTLKVTKQLRWLQLAEIEYCRVSNLQTNNNTTTTTPAPEGAHVDNNINGSDNVGGSGGGGLRPRTFGQWEVVQRTTPSSSSTGNSNISIIRLAPWRYCV